MFSNVFFFSFGNPWKSQIHFSPKFQCLGQWKKCMFHSLGNEKGDEMDNFFVLKRLS